MFLIKGKKKARNLTKYLKEIENKRIAKEEVHEILMSISIDELEQNYITENKFRMDYIIGFGRKDIPAKYIGVLKRKEEKLRKIKEQEKRIEEETSLLNHLENLKNKKIEEINQIKIEQKSFPIEEKLIEEEQKKETLIYDSKRYAEEIAKEEEQKEKITKEIEALVKELTDLKKDIHLATTCEIYTSGIEDTNNLILELSKLKGNISNYRTKKEMQESYAFQQNELEEEINYLYEEIHEISQEKKKNEAEKKDLEEILNSDKYKNQANELSEIERKLKEIPEQLKRNSERIGSLKAQTEELERTEENLKKEKEEKEKIRKIYETFFEEEYNLHYVMKEPITDIYKDAKQVVTTLSHRKDSNLTNAANNYYSAFNEYRLNLNDYNLSQIELFEKIEIDSEYMSLYEENKRPDIRAMFQGKKLTLYELSTTLTNAIEENHLIMNDQDRRLFEEILLKTIGNKIKERIISSQAWVKEINDIMASMQQNSALAFSLNWKTKDAESMEEMDTKELVRLFKSPTGTREDADSKKLIDHFRSKLKRTMEYKGDTANYANVIFEVLDYRNWFEFKLMYQRAGDIKKELTDKVFSVFSGGEKAKTMYIPLFAAVSSKLNSAKEHTLRLVALDEAFAGVDEGNIKEMFGILESLKLDYILTSQALTGDYDTIKELAIAELLRPNNAQVVGIRRKKWNGKNMEVILRKEITKDVDELF